VARDRPRAHRKNNRCAFSPSTASRSAAERTPSSSIYSRVCEQWLSAWEIIVAVTPDDITTIEAADDHLPNVLSLEAFLRSLDNDLATLAADDPTYHERRLEFCREVCTQFPDAPDEFLLDFRHFVADSLTALGRVTESRSEFETLIRDYPEDP